MKVEPRARYESLLERVRDYQIVFGSEVGQRVLYDLMQAAGLFTINQDVEPGVLAAKQGQKNMILRIMGLVDANPEQIKEQMKQGESNE